jgi:hypothetical protein
MWCSMCVVGEGGSDEERWVELVEYSFVSCLHLSKGPTVDGVTYV